MSEEIKLSDEQIDKWFRVEVTDGLGQVVAIEPEMLAGRDIGTAEELTIIRAIKHLSGFVGNDAFAPAHADEPAAGIRSEWIAVSERLPEDQISVLIVADGDSWIGWHEDDEWF